MIKQQTCYKNPNKPACIELIVTNVLSMFQSTCVLETRISGYSFNDSDSHEENFQENAS